MRDLPAQDFVTAIMRDEDLAGFLSGIVKDDSFLAEAMAYGRARNVTLPPDIVSSMRSPDVLGLARFSPPLCGGSALPPRHWLPVAIAAAPEGTAVDWARLGPQPLRASFYEDEIRRALALPFNRAFRYRTGLRDLIAQSEALDSLEPDGFIFHMSRCGSTLVSRMLAELDDSIVISEAPPIDIVLQLTRQLPEEDAARALRAIVLAFGRRRDGAERRYVVKLDCWHTLALPAFRCAFPDAPWLFLYRDPVEVLVSQMRQRGAQTMPQYLPPSFYGIGAAEGTTEEDYCARVLAAVCGPALDHRGSGGLVLNYQHLPDAVFTTVLPHFGLSCSDAERDRMRETALPDAKAPSVPFGGDAEEKQRAATDAVRDAAARHLGEIYARLERSAGGRRAAQ
jgi:hypothetical protein